LKGGENILMKTANLLVRKGFTLIELLIVIAVLGILSIAVLSAINPIEQINRSRDTGSRSDAEQLISASDRYYASVGYYAWQTDRASTNLAISPMAIITSTTQTFGVDLQPALTRLSSAGTAELKAAFISRIVAGGSSRLAIYNQGVAGQSTYVCFLPQSSSFKTEAWKRCTAHTDYGTLPPDWPVGVLPACPAGPTCLGVLVANAGTNTGCYSCLP